MGTCIEKDANLGGGGGACICERNGEILRGAGLT